MRNNAKKEKWIPMEIRGVKGYFSDVRIDRDTVPEWLHFWELADADCNGILCRYRPGILANFYGTFLTTGELPIDYPYYKEGYLESEEQYYFDSWTILEFHEIETLEKENIKDKNNVE